MHVVAKRRTRSQARIGANDISSTEGRRFEMAESCNTAAGTNLGVLQDAVWTDLDAIGKFDAALEQANSRR